MADKSRKDISNIVSRIVDNYEKSDIPMFKAEFTLPNRHEIYSIVEDLRMAMFPGYYGEKSIKNSEPGYYAGFLLTDIYDRLKMQILLAIAYNYDLDTDISCLKNNAEIISDAFFEELPDIQNMLLKDARAGYDGDPAAATREEIIFSYPGFFAIYVFRIAHALYAEGVPFIPRIMSEYAHGKTGIDIHPGASIGEYFFIDHGTGVVIGETCNIGRNVKLYQGVTLGALSTKHVSSLKGTKRHPTVEDNVTIYSNATILGGDTVISEGSVVGGNSFITESIPKNSKISRKL